MPELIPAAPGSPEPEILSVDDLNPDERIAWRIACERGLAMTVNDLRALIMAYEWGHADA